MRHATQASIAMRGEAKWACPESWSAHVHEVADALHGEGQHHLRQHATAISSPRIACKRSMSAIESPATTVLLRSSTRVTGGCSKRYRAPRGRASWPWLCRRPLRAPRRCRPPWGTRRPRQTWHAHVTQLEITATRALHCPRQACRQRSALCPAYTKEWPLATPERAHMQRCAPCLAYTGRGFLHARALME